MKICIAASLSALLSAVSLADDCPRPTASQSQQLDELAAQVAKWDDAYHRQAVSYTHLTLPTTPYV